MSHVDFESLRVIVRSILHRHPGDELDRRIHAEALKLAAGHASLQSVRDDPVADMLARRICRRLAGG